MIIHLFTADKFAEPYINFINSNFDKNDHVFYIIGDENFIKNKEIENVIFFKKDILNLFRIIIKMNKSKKIIVHGLFHNIVVRLLFFQPWLLIRSNWFIWGSDLYYYRVPKITFKSKLNELFRKKVIKNFGSLSTQVEGEVDLARKWYGAKGEYKYSFLYLSNIYKDCNREVEKEYGKRYIQIGNSAAVTNNHKEVFEKLVKYKDEDIKIIVPLSYGDEDYKNEIIKLGINMFGEKFVPITDFMDSDKYIDLLNKIDVAIFNHNRQQALGNITTLLGLGKKVYIRSNISTWRFCEQHKLKVYDSNLKDLSILEDITERDKINNIKRVRESFNEKKLKIDMEKIFK